MVPFRQRDLTLRFVSFAAVGATGTAVHMLTLWAVMSLRVGFFSAQGYAVVMAMTWTFLANNTVTYRDQRLRGRDIPRGIATFYGVAAIGAVVNLTVGDCAYIMGSPWWLAALCGAMAGVGWNFSMTRLTTWRRVAG